MYQTSLLRLKVSEILLLIARQHFAQKTESSFLFSRVKRSREVFRVVVFHMGVHQDKRGKEKFNRTVFRLQLKGVVKDLRPIFQKVFVFIFLV